MVFYSSIESTELAGTTLLGVAGSGSSTSVMVRRQIRPWLPIPRDAFRLDADR
jgi:hypothetical protein